MAVSILPVEYEVPPYVADAELEDLVLQVLPELEDRPAWDLRACTAQLRSAVEKLLLGYRQSLFMAEHGASMLPPQQWLLSETIADNFRWAWRYAEALPALTPAFELFLANMDVDGDGLSTRH